MRSLLPDTAGTVPSTDLARIHKPQNRTADLGPDQNAGTGGPDPIQKGQGS